MPLYHYARPIIDDNFAIASQLRAFRHAMLCRQVIFSFSLSFTAVSPVLHFHFILFYLAYYLY